MLEADDTNATITVRVIKSFEFRTERNLVVRHINLERTTIRQLKDIVLQAIQSQPAWKAYRNVVLGIALHMLNKEQYRFDFEDTIKLYTRAHGSKATNLIINLDHDDWIIENDDNSLTGAGFEHETEVSFFNRTQYEAFKQDPQTRWDC